LHFILTEWAVATLQSREIGPDVDPMPGVEVAPRDQIRIAVRALTEERDRQHPSDRDSDEQYHCAEEQLGGPDLH
jgi:hypothetical protein